jgi:D-xylose 1-dehydrogenase (NADP+, D-xylono-1,5-lactone-forming)
VAIEPVRWGILGTARINTKWLAGARGTPTAEVVALGSRSRERGEAFAETHGIPRVHDSYEALLGDPEVEAIYDSLPNALHHPWTMRALEAGKHVLCEKPYSRHPEEVVEAFDLAESSGLVLSEAFMWRHHPQAAALRELLPGLGPIRLVRASFGFPLEDPSDVRLSPELAGGCLMDVGCYSVSGARFVAGEEPESVFGIATWGPTGVDLDFAGLLRFPSGLVAQVASSFTADHRGLEVVGATESIRLVDPWQSQPALMVTAAGERSFPPIDPYQLELEDFAGAVRRVTAPRLGRADALGQARAIEALYRSAETGLPVAL